jgi:SynChlorMet cassette radical SAM/SPASM protein ScmF
MQPGQIRPLAFIRLVEEAIDLGLQHVKITGGEALLRADLFEIIREVRALGIDVSMETNGYLIDPTIADLLIRYQVGVSISLDGGSAATHDKLRGHPGSFDRVVRALRMLSDRGSDPKVIMSISRRNLDEVEAVIAVAVENGSRMVKLNPVNTLGQAARLSATTFLLSIEELIDLYRRRQELEARYDVFLFLEGPPAFASIFEIATGHSAICPFTNLLGVLADGSLSFCGVANTCDELILARIDDDGFDLRRFWNEAKPLLEVRELMSRRIQGVCSQCILEPFCKGSCRALAYGAYKRFLAPHPWCQVAFEDGCFPAHYLKRKEVTTDAN